MMIACILDLVIFTFFWAIIGWEECDGEFIAINSSRHAHYYFLRTRTRNEGSIPPIESDPAFANALDRKRICKEITRSGFFELHDLRPVRMKDVFEQLKEPQYSDIFSRIYTRQEASTSFLHLQPTYEYTNQYAPKDIQIDNPSTGQATRVTESVFVCVLKRNDTNGLVAKYVSREYNVFGDPYMPGHFVFDNIREEEADHTRILYQSVSLAEEPAHTEENTNFSKVELQYLHIRKYFQPVHSDARDPLCRLLPQEDVRKNQQYRLCVAVSRSSYFKEKVRYPRMSNPHNYNGCNVVNVSFRTQEAIQKAAEQSYHERMAECHFVDKFNARKRVTVYLSRGYRTNQVFVYRLDNSDEKVYLENVSTNVTVADIKVLFEDVED